jgi:hypothetical protein
VPLQDALPAAIRTILDDEEADVYWRDRAEGTAFRAAVNVQLTRISSTRIGVDEQRHEQEGADDVRETIVGNRRVIVQFQVETDDQDLADSAHEVAEDIVQGLHRTDVLDALDTGAGLGAGQVQPVREVPYKDKHGRWRSAAMFEVWFPAARAHTGALIARVKTVVASGDVDGTAVGPLTVDEG